MSEARVKSPRKEITKQGEATGTIFNIQKFSLHDGPGIRTTVFLKGCPLKCQWCSNAESMNPGAELGILRNLCNNCAKCVDACPEGAITLDAGQIIQIDRAKCTACGECVDACPADALTIYGKQITSEDAFNEVYRDRSFYESGGGVTVSGGEPLRQADFVVALFRMCREASIGTCLDTSGYANPNTLKKVLEFTDYVLYDIKHMDTECHKSFTGVTNDLILGNARLVAASGVQMLCRIPLIVGVNDSAENISATVRLVKTLRDDAAVELLPYHRLGIAKYQTLDRTYPGEAFTTPSPERLEAARHIFEEHGISCNTGG